MKKVLLVFLLAFALVMTACGNETSTPATEAEADADTTVEDTGADNAPSSDAEVNLKATHAVAPTHPYHMGLEKFAEIVAEKTDGRVKIDIFHSGQLGNERDSIEGLQLGTVDIAVSSTAPIGTFVKDFQMLDLPFIFEDYATADEQLDGELGQALLAKLEPLGVIGGAFWENGFREITTSEDWGPIESVEDLKGLKIRTQESEVHMNAFKELGADPTPMAFSEVFTSLQSGVLDAQENPVPIIYNNKLYEAQANLSLTNHFYSPSTILFSKKMFDGLDAETQQIFMDAAKEAALYEREQIRKQEAEQVGLLKEEGMNIVEPDTTAFREAVQPVYEQYQNEFDAELMNLLLK